MDQEWQLLYNGPQQSNRSNGNEKVPNTWFSSVFRKYFII